MQHQLLSLSLSLAVVATSLMSCSQPPQTQSETTTVVSTSPTSPGSATPLTPATGTSDLDTQYQTALQEIQTMQPPAIPPSIVSIGVDQSGSMANARVTPAALDEMLPILSELGRQGGTLAMSAICDRSNRPLVRVTFPEPPRLDEHQVTVAPPPERPDGDRGNPFHHKQALKDYEKARQAHEQEIAQALQGLETHRQALAQHQASADAQIAAVQPDIEAILQHPRTCQATDIQNAVQRTNWLLAEPHNWSQPPRTYAVFITDGLDSFASTPVSLAADHTILVNGDENVGIFNGVDHQRFESPQSALVILTTWLQTPVQN